MAIELTEPPKQNASTEEVQQYVQKQFLVIKGLNKKRIVSRDLNAIDSPGGVFNFVNSTKRDFIITRVIVSLSTPSTGAATLDVGASSSATTSSDNLIDGLDINGASGLFDNFTNPGGNGLNMVTVPKGEFVTGSIASGASAGLVGTVYIEFIET